MSLRNAINAKCRDCICDTLDAGTAAQQIACCVDSKCPLHAVRPITATVIPIRLLEAQHVTPEQLDAKARALVRVSSIALESGQTGPTLSTESMSGGER